MQDDKPMQPAPPAPSAAPLSDSDLQYLLEKVFRWCTSDEKKELEAAAGGQGNLIACLDSFVEEDEGYDEDEFPLFRSNIIYRCNELNNAHLLTPEALNRCVERWKDAAPPQEKKPSTRRNRQSNSFRDQTIRALKEKGLSGAKAERGFRGVRQVIVRAIGRGEVVELLGLGTIQAVGRKRTGETRWFGRHYNISTVNR